MSSLLSTIYMCASTWYLQVGNQVPHPTEPVVELNTQNQPQQCDERNVTEE